MYNMTAKEANIKVNSLKTEIQKEIWRLQMCDYLTENSYNTLYEMQKELKDLKIK